MSKPLTIDDAVKFIRKNGVCNLDDDNLILQLRKAIQNHGFDYIQDQQGNISGLYFGKWEQPFTVFRLYMLLGRGSLYELVKKFKSRFPLLQEVRTGRHQKLKNQLKSTYSDEVVETIYHPQNFKLVS